MTVENSSFVKAINAVNQQIAENRDLTYKKLSDFFNFEKKIKNEVIEIYKTHNANGVLFIVPKFQELPLEAKRQYAIKIFAYFKKTNLSPILEKEFGRDFNPALKNIPPSDEAGIEYWLDLLKDYMHILDVYAQLAITENDEYDSKLRIFTFINPDYKSQISSHISHIREIIKIQNDVSEKKKSNIYDKLSGLQLEIDKEKTTYEEILVNMVDLSKAIGQTGKNLKPVTECLGNLIKDIGEAAQKINTLRIEHKVFLSLPAPDSNENLTDD